MREQLLGQLHQVGVIGIRLVELQHRELGIVLGRDALVTEVAVDLVDAIEAADEQALEVELGSDPQVEVHVERVVVRLERPGDGATGDRLHHRRLHLEEAARVEKLPQRLDHAGAEQENRPRVGIDDEIHVALAVACLDVLEPMPLLGQRTKRLGQKGERLHGDGQLAGAGAEHLAGDPDEVADVELGEGGEVPELIGPRIELDPSRLVLQVREARLAVMTDGDETTGQAHRPRRLQLVLGRLLEPLVQRAGPVADREATAERVDSART